MNRPGFAGGIGVYVCMQWPTVRRQKFWDRRGADFAESWVLSALTSPQANRLRAGGLDDQARQPLPLDGLIARGDPPRS